MNKIYKAFPGGKHKVLTLSYDDGKVQDRRLVKIFNKYGIKATFNLNSGLTDMKNRIPEKLYIFCSFIQSAFLYAIDNFYKN